MFPPVAKIRSILICLIVISQKINSIQSSQTPQQLRVELINETGHNVDVYWINENTGDLVLSISGLSHGETKIISTFEGHSFNLREVSLNENGQCALDVCGVTYFTARENKVYHILEGMILSTYGKKSLVNVNLGPISFSDCQEQALDYLRNSPGNIASAIDKVAECSEFISASIIESSMNEIDFHADARTTAASLLENYTCADENLPTTKPIETNVWAYKNRNITVNILQERPHSKIHLLENFITEDECKAIEKKANRKGFIEASTLSEGGGSEVSNNRKAIQANIYVSFFSKYFENSIALLRQRVFDYTNAKTNYDLVEFWQEEMVSIQYNGRGEDEISPDQYMPHCDGQCRGRSFRGGGRVATMVMYCDVPEKGGATNFANSGIHIVPKAGNAVFFSYMGDDGIMDKGFTQHSGCPVLEGKKTIVTQWMRKDVNISNFIDALYNFAYA